MALSFDMSARRCVCALLGLLVLMPALAAAERVHRYRVSADAELTRLTVRACFAGQPPSELVADSLDAPGAFLEARVVDQRTRLAANGTELRLREVPADGCVEYAVNVTGNGTRHDYSGNSTRRIGRDLFTEVGLWFWRPVQLGADEDVEVEFDMPAGLSVSAPWMPVLKRERPTYRVGRGPADRHSAVAFGRCREIPLEVPGAVLRLAILDGNPPADVEALRTWIEDAARSVAAVYGRFPVPSPQILVMPGARAAEPTPWAYVLRGGQAAAHFFVNQRRPLREYVDDWTAPHELSHLLLPYVRSQDAWLSEGMASYYQGIVRARSGAISPEEAWQRMHSSFKRARDWSAKGATLAQATERMFRDGGYMRVYWSGAAMLLLADVRLRAASGGAQSLDTVLEAFGRCCLDPDREWTARQVFERFDQIAGGTVFRDLYAAHVNAEGFPDLSGVYAELGLRALGGKVELADRAPLSQVRDAIMAPGGYRSPAALLGAR
ncbi:MAG: hypothetical protein ACK6DF_01395 [Betaproteobacteria bacterium]